MKPIEKENYKEFDEFELYMTIIESVAVSFNPTRTIEFKVIRPFDQNESQLRYQGGTLIFNNVIECSMELVNMYYEYPEFYRSAVLDDSDILKVAKDRYQQLGGNKEVEFKHYYLYIDYGKKESEVHLVCEKHELIIQTEPKLLTDFEGLKE